MRTRSDLYITSSDALSAMRLASKHRKKSNRRIGEYSLAVRAVICFLVKYLVVVLFWYRCCRRICRVHGANARVVMEVVVVVVECGVIRKMG